MGFFLKKHNIDNIFFIGIGGIGMSGLAELLISEGCKVKGTDTGESQIIERLKKWAPLYTISTRQKMLSHQR